MTAPTTVPVLDEHTIAELTPPCQPCKVTEQRDAAAAWLGRFTPCEHADGVVLMCTGHRDAAFRIQLRVTNGDSFWTCPSGCRVDLLSIGPLR